VDVKTKEVKFAVKDKSPCDMQEVQKVIEGAGYTVAAVKSQPSK